VPISAADKTLIASGNMERILKKQKL